MSQKQNIPDKANCTYWWIMYLNPNFAGNTVETITGYSKFQSQAEANNKINCLMSKIEMFYKNGYIERSLYIEVYKRIGALPSKQNDRLILILKENDYQIPDNLVFKIPFELKTFLNNFYDCIYRKKPIKNLRPIVDRSFSKDSLYDLAKYNFKKIKDLHDWCEKKISEGEAREQVLKFYLNYSQKYLLR